MTKKVIIIGSGFAGLSAAAFMAKQGWNVKVIEKNPGPGGRAGQLVENGFKFDKGPSFYWMPEIFESFFNRFGKKVEDYYTLRRLDPSYRIYWEDGWTDLPANMDQLKQLFESIEPGSAQQLEKYLREAGNKYDISIQHFLYKPGNSILEFLNWPTLRQIFKLDVFISMKKHIHKHFKHPKLRQILEFPILFLGALPENTPALYSLMNYADLKGGTWYPEGGIYSVVDAMHRLAIELGVEFKFKEKVININVEGTRAKTVITDKETYQVDAVISAADYHFTETVLLQPSFRTYSDTYWNSRIMAPSCLLYYVGINKKLRSIVHHSLFFDVSFAQHGEEIYDKPGWPQAPLFYVSVASTSSVSVAPEGCENLVMLVPVAAGLEGDSEELREKYFQIIMKRMEKHTGESLLDAVIYKKTYSVTDFKEDYNSFRGNAYGLANTLKQTAIFKPSCRSKKVKNLFYSGQLTVPGPGVPPSIVSGEVVAREVVKAYGSEI